MKGLVLFTNGKMDEGIELIERAFSNKPITVIDKVNFFKEIKRAGIYQAEFVDYQRGIRCLDLALSIFIDAEVLAHKGIALKKLSKFVQAEECFKLVLQIKPADKIGFYEKGSALFVMGEYEEAKKCYEAALKIDPKFTDALTKMTKLESCMSEKQHDDQRTAEIKAEQFKPADKLGLYDKGNVLFAMGEYEEAKGCYEAALKIDPKFTDALTKMAKLESCMNEKQLADQREAEIKAAQSATAAAGAAAQSAMTADMQEQKKYDDLRREAGAELKKLQEDRKKQLENHLENLRAQTSVAPKAQQQSPSGSPIKVNDHSATSSPISSEGSPATPSSTDSSPSLNQTNSRRSSAQFFTAMNTDAAGAFPKSLVRSSSCKSLEDDLKTVVNSNKPDITAN